ncbi:MAG: hypothetical protein JO101_07245 [Candidatus Eremiobacteraeota bacterium]|nr:hypothetical protein [Candidatus Eremiobacteraeota bacterium]MBV8355100.1 hypothetical protein [Candidatus Eremiobacteraeota bacterium]
MNASMMGSEVLKLVRSGVDVASIHAQARHPFRIFLCGDAGLVAEFRAVLLSGHTGGEVPFDAAATLETLVPGRKAIIDNTARAVVFLGRAGDREGAEFRTLLDMQLPTLAVTVDPSSATSGPAAPPEKAAIGDYVVPALEPGALRQHVFPHLVHTCGGVEVAVARRLPILREHCAAKLTRDCAKRSLTIAAASAVIDHVPLAGIVLGAVASAGDMVAITGLQMALVLQIGSCYGRDPDLQRVWELLPVVGTGFGWRALSRELSGFIPIAGIAIKGAIAYAGTIVVGEGVMFYYEHGRQMSAADAAKLYEDAKSSAMTFAREMVARLRNRK